MARKPPKSPEQRLARWSRSMAPGTLNGRVASATPLTLDVTRLAPRLRQRQGGGGFDPNENPVIIGLGATSGSGTPDNPSAGVDGAVAIGDGAEADGDFALAVGLSAVATGRGSVSLGSSSAEADEAIAIGDNATAWTASTVAIGDHAVAGVFGGGGSFTTVVGASARATGNNSVAIGATAHATHANAGAIGRAATSHHDSELALGSTGTFVSVPGNPGGLVFRHTLTDALQCVVSMEQGGAIPTPGQALRTNLWDTVTDAPASPPVGAAGIIFSSPDGTQWLLGVSNAGAAIATAV